jgi:hypothetical protein
MKKLTEITPSRFRCGDWGCCPAVFKDADGTYQVIGELVEPSPELEGRVGEKEIVARIPGNLLEEAIQMELQRREAKK